MKRDLTIVWVVMFAMIALSSQIHSAIGLLFLAPFAAIWIYVRLHEHFHQMRGSRWNKNLTGIGLASTIGFSWQIYGRHHANHHKFNNGPGDYSSTLSPSGRPQNGLYYLLRNASFPFALQLVPYLSVLGMRKQNRNVFSWIDESARFGLRLLAFLIGGWWALAALLGFQWIAVNTIFVANYLQHFDVAPQFTRDWQSSWFAKNFSNFGAHQHHHDRPEIASDKLQVQAPVIETLPLFSPKVWINLLQSPSALTKVLKAHEITRTIP